MKTFLKALFMAVVVLLAGVGISYGASELFDYVEVDQNHPSASSTKTSFGKNGIAFTSGSSVADDIRTWDGADLINFGAGDDYVSMSDGNDSFSFGGTTTSEDSIIGFDYYGSFSDVWTNSANYMRVDHDNANSRYDMKVKADSVTVVSDDGDIILQLGD
jgi:Ca2+-binding RTX toxin-like protein